MKKISQKINSVRYLRDVLEVVLAFIIAWIFYQGLAIATGTSTPIVSVVSESMEPVLHRGDLVFVVAPKQLQVGDIVIYQKNSGGQFTIIHRIVRKNDDGSYVIKGDNNAVADRPDVRPSQINGKLLFSVPLLGYPRLALYALGI